jgi:hypothetical protein
MAWVKISRASYMDPNRPRCSIRKDDFKKDWVVHHSGMEASGFKTFKAAKYWAERNVKSQRSLKHREHTAECHRAYLRGQRTRRGR